MSWYSYGGFDPYVPVGKRISKAKKEMEKLAKKGMEIHPVEIQGRKIAKTFWGQAWCDHIESLGDFANRLPRGRTYVRNGSVVHLGIHKGKVDARVAGRSGAYKVSATIKTLPKAKWNHLKQLCSGQIGTLVELLKGELSKNLMQVVTDPKDGLFPLRNEISYSCSCPDGAYMCKHIAAMFYGVGASLDQKPSLLFLLRDVDHEELIDVDAQITAPNAAGSSKKLEDTDLSQVFGVDIDINEPVQTVEKKTPKKKTTKKNATKKKTPKKTTVKKTATKKKTPKKKTTVKKTTTKKKTATQKKTPKKKTTKKNTEV